MVVTDGTGDGAVTYQVPLTYRSAALPGAGASLIGTSEHGVLGRRWVYDGTGDPVFVAQLVALIQGEAEPQAQSLSSTPDPTVTGMPVTDGSLKVTGSAVVASGQAGTDLRIETRRKRHRKPPADRAGPPDPAAGRQRCPGRRGRAPVPFRDLAAA